MILSKFCDIFELFYCLPCFKMSETFNIVVAKLPLNLSTKLNSAAHKTLLLIRNDVQSISFSILAILFILVIQEAN